MGSLTVKPEHRMLVVESGIAMTCGTWLVALMPSPPLPVIGAACALLCAALLAVVLACGGSPALGLPIASWPLLTGGWVAYARHWHAAWTWAGALALLGPATVLTVWLLIAYVRWCDDENTRNIDAAERARRELLARWERALAGAGFDGIRCTLAVETRQGHEVTLRLPSSGRITLSTLSNGADRIATAFRLPTGSVAFTESRHAGEVVMSLDEADVLADDVTFPAVSGLMTITKPIPIGVRPGGKPFAVRFRELAALITGVTGSGKTNLENVITAQLTRCVDTVTFMIDLKGGRLAAPWIRPWVEGRCSRPAVDWVATTRGEVEIMLRAIERVIDARSSSLIGGSKITPSRELPQFNIVCDEIADCFGDVPKDERGERVSNQDLAAIGAKVTRKARSEAVMPVWGTQKGTVDFTGSSAIKSQCRLRFSLATASQSDAQSVVDNVHAARLLSHAQHAGSVLVTLPGQTEQELIKVYRLDADDDAQRIDELAEAAGNTVAHPSQLDLDAMGADYADRWERSELYQLMLAQHQGVPRSDLAPAQAAPAQEAAPARTALATPDVNDEFAAITAQLGDIGQDKPDPRNRMYALLAEKPLFGMSVLEIGAALKRDGLGVARETVHRWLRQDIDAGKIEHKGAGPGSRYLLRRDGSQ